MKLEKIEINPDTSKIIVMGDTELCPVILRYKGWFGRKKTIYAYPTNMTMRSRYSKAILYHIFCDANGLYLGEKKSIIITSFLFIQSFSK